MIIRPKKKKKKREQYSKNKSFYDDYLDKNYKRLDPKSLAYKDAKAAKEFLEKMRARKSKLDKKRKVVKPITPKVIKSRLPTMSVGERRVWKYLIRNKIKFEREQEFEGMCNRFGFGNLRIDFYLPDLRIAIEYDGQQHFEASKKFDTDKNTLEHRQGNDKAKDRYCRDNGILMIRISYKEFNEIEVILNKELPLSL